MSRGTRLAACALLLAVAGGCDGTPGQQADRRRDEANAFVAAYAASVAEGTASLIRTRSWPSQGYEGLKVETVAGDLRDSHVAYEIVATVSEESVCQGAIQGGLHGAASVRIGRLAFLPSEVRQYVEPGSGKGSSSRTVRPADYLCHDRSWPVVLRFGHDSLVAVPEPASTRGARP